jgi:hypothetical protein
VNGSEKERHDMHSPPMSRTKSTILTPESSSGIPIFSLCSKPEIEAFITLILGSPEVLALFLRIHCIPLLIPPRVHVTIEEICQWIQDETDAANDEQSGVPLNVSWCVARLIDIRTNNLGQLYGHVVKRSGDGSSSDRSGITRTPCDLYSVYVWVSEQNSEDSKVLPARNVLDSDQGYQTRCDPLIDQPTSNSSQF